MFIGVFFFFNVWTTIYNFTSRFHGIYAVCQHVIGIYIYAVCQHMTTSYGCYCVTDICVGFLGFFFNIVRSVANSSPCVR